MVAPVEIGAGGIELLVGNGLLKEEQVGDSHAVGEACLLALEQWAAARGPRTRLARSNGSAPSDARTTPWTEGSARE